MRNSTRMWFVTAVAALGAAAQAQDADRAPASPPGPLVPTPYSQVQMALGAHLAGPYDVQNTITAPPTPGAAWNRMLGVARAWGYYWVSGGAGTTGAFMIHQFDLNGVYIQGFVQNVANSASTPWGARDLAVDEANFKLWGGMENSQLKEYTFNPAGGPNGTLTFTTGYTLPAGVGIVRALARNPNTGTFYTKNFNSPLYEYSIAGGVPTLVATHNTNGKSTYGLAYDTVNNTLWEFDQNAPGGGAVATDGVMVSEIDLTGNLTTREFQGVIYGVLNTNIAGGCDIFNDGSGVLKIVALHQNTADELNVYELDPTSTTPPPTNYCTSSTSTNGCVAVMGSTGTPSASASSGFVLTCTGLEGQKSGIQFYGITGQAATPWSTGSTSFLCVKVPTQRMGTQNSGGTNGACDGNISTDFLAFVAANPGSLGTPLVAGATFDAQTWFRDPPAPKTTNLSDGLHFTLAP
jgi:hypothetical protein